MISNAETADEYVREVNKRGWYLNEMEAKRMLSEAAERQEALRQAGLLPRVLVYVVEVKEVNND